mgnify:CR=1 FL=1
MFKKEKLPDSSHFVFKKFFKPIFLIVLTIFVFWQRKNLAVVIANAASSRNFSIEESIKKNLSAMSSEKKLINYGDFILSRIYNLSRTFIRNRLLSHLPPSLVIVSSPETNGNMPFPTANLTPTEIPFTGNVTLTLIPTATPSLTSFDPPAVIATPTSLPTNTPTAVPTEMITPTPIPTQIPTQVPSQVFTPTLTPTPTSLKSGGDYRVLEGVIYHNNQEVALRGVNWFGFETANNVPHGLWSRNYKDMIKQMRDLGFNAVRLPFCPNTIVNKEVSGIDYSKNQELQGLKSLEIMDKIIDELKSQGMYFVLDHHRPDCNSISELPATYEYSESQWISDLVFLAQRYRAYDNFVGIDLKNEPHGAATWGTGESTDWKLSAERAGRAVLEANPNILVFVEGIQNNPSCSDNSIAHWWGGNLEPQACFPLDLPTEKLVLSPHVYGPDVFAQDYFNAPDFPNNMPAIWEKHFGFLSGKYALAIGEWGGKYGAGDPRDIAWQNAFVEYLSKKGICNSFYWSWNPNSGDTGGILNDDWQTVREDKINLLRDYTTNCRQ